MPPVITSLQCGSETLRPRNNLSTCTASLALAIRTSTSTWACEATTFDRVPPAITPQFTVNLRAKSVKFEMV